MKPFTIVPGLVSEIAHETQQAIYVYHESADHDRQWVSHS